MNNDKSDSNNSDSEGWSSYAVQGKYWNDVDIGSSSAQSVKTYDSSSATLSESSVTVTISGSRGGYFSASGFDHHILSGYIDDNANNTSPLVTFANIPFGYYKVVVYFAADVTSTRFGYITLNDTVNLYGDGTGTDIGIDADGWGGCAPHVNKQNNFQPGRNILVSPVLKNTTSSTLKVQSRSYWPDATYATYRSGIAAIQVVKAEAPAACTYTVSEGGTYDLFGDGATSYWSASEPLTGSEAVTISISGDTTLTVNDSRVFASLTVTGSGTLTLAGTGEIVTPSVTVNSGVTLLKTTGQLLTSAAVSVPESSALEIANSCTWSGVISGAGFVKVSANPVTFSAGNTYTGGLVVTSGGLAKSENSTGWGSKTVMAVTVRSGGTLDISGEYSTGYNFFIAGTGVDSQGALVNSTAITYGGNLPGNLTLSADATIDCFNAFGVGGGKSLNLNGHILTIKATSAETAKQFYVHGSYMNGGTTANTGKIVLQSNVQLYSNNGNGISSGQQAILLEAQSGSSVSVGASSGNFPVSNTTIADGAALTVDGTLNLQNGKTLTVNGTANISGTANIGQSGNAGSHLVVGGTVNVNGSGTIKLVSTSNITQNGSGVINIAANAQVWWINCAWTSTAGDIFRGEGTLNLDGNYTHTFSNSGFTGKLKATHSGNFIFDNYPAFTGRPELICNCSADNKGFVISGGYAGNSLNVRNLNGGLSYFTCTYNDPTATRVVDTLQTRDTEFSGKFISEDSASKRKTGLVVRGSAETGVHSLTLTTASTTFGGATVQDYGKLIFSSAGSWANGTVTVADGGYLEVNYSGTVASTLDLQSGGTIIIQTVTTTTTTGEGDEAVVETTTSVVPIAAGTVTFPDSGEAVIDISAIPDLASDESLAIINAATSLDSDVSKIRLVGKPYSLAVDGNALKVVNDGGLVWDSANGWNGKDVTKYGEATITSPGTVALDGTSLSFDTLTLTGSGTVSFSSTDSATVTADNISIAAGVTLMASSVLNLGGATITMSGTSAYETSAMIVVPDGVTLAMDGTTVNGNGYTRIIVQSGGTLELIDVTCTAKIYAQNGANVKTYGNCVLNSTAWHLFEYGSTLTVESDNTQLQAEGKGLGGKIIVKSGATFTNARTDALKFDASASAKAEVELWGTLAMGSSRWTLGENNLITLHEGSEITGASAADGNFVLNGCTVNAYGNASINANVRAASGTTSIVFVDTGKTLKLTKAFATSSGTGTLTKTGSGTLRLEDVMCSSAGQTTEPSLTGSEGTIEFYSNSDHRYLNQPIAFSGHVKFTQGGSKELVVNNATLFSNRPSLEVSGGFTLHSNLSSANAVLAVRNLSGSGSVSPKFADDTVARMVDTLQDANTTFSGKFIHDVVQRTTGDYDRCTGLTVRGDGTSIVHTLELTGDNDTTGPLSVLDYGKVLFSGSTASWKNGTVTIKNNGFLQSNSSAEAVAATLTLENGATIVRGSQPVSATSLSALSEGATVKVAFADGVSPVDGMVVLSGEWETTPDASCFTFADGSTSLVSGGYTYTFAVSDSAVTLEGALALSIGEPEVVYMADFASATVTASLANHVNGMTYSLSGIGNSAIAGTVNEEGTSVTFALSNLEALSTYNYTITASYDGSTATKSASTVAATPVSGTWINETKATIGTTGTWTPSAPAFGDNDYASLSGTNTFAKAADATGSGIVTLTTVVNFSAEADSSLEIDASGKAAIRVSKEDSAYVYQLWTKASSSASAEWLTVSGPTITGESLEANTTVVFEFNTTFGTYKAKVGDTWLTYNSSDTFTFANGGNTIGSVMYVGSGKFTSLTGEYATADIMEPVGGTNIVVNTSYISQYYGSSTVAEAKAALAPTAAKGTNGMNALDAYALGLAPEADQPMLAVSVDADGKFVVTMTKADGTAIEPPSNIELKTKLKVGTSPDSIETLVDGNTIDPTTQEGAVKYYKAEVDYFAK